MQVSGRLCKLIIYVVLLYPVIQLNYIRFFYQDHRLNYQVYQFFCLGYENVSALLIVYYLSQEKNLFALWRHKNILSQHLIIYYYQE